MRYKSLGFRDRHVMPQSTWLVINPIMLNNFAVLYNCMPVGRDSDSMIVNTFGSILLGLLGLDVGLFLGPAGGLLLPLFLSSAADAKGSPGVSTSCYFRVLILASSQSFH